MKRFVPSHCALRTADRSASGFRRALELDPNNVFAHRYLAATLEALGRFFESIDEAQRALALSPMSALLESAYARHLFRARKFDESIRYYQRAIELDARDFGTYTPWPKSTNSWAGLTRRWPSSRRLCTNRMQLLLSLRSWRVPMRSQAGTPRRSKS